MEQWISLRQASELSGKTVPALRQAIKRGKLSGKKVTGPMGDKWLVDALSIGINTSFVNSKHTPEEHPDTADISNHEFVYSDQLNSENSRGMDRTATLYERIIEEKDKLEDARSKHIDTLNILLRDFQNRIHILEHDKSDMESQLKLLPAPPREITKQLDESKQELEKSRALLKEAMNEKKLIQEQAETLSARMDQLKKASQAVLEENRGLKGRIENYEQEILTYKITENRLKKLEEDLLGLNSKKEHLEKENQSLSVELNQVKIARNEYKNQVEIRERDNRELIAEREKIQKATADIWNEKEQLEKQLETEKRKPWWKKLI